MTFEIDALDSDGTRTALFSKSFEISSSREPAAHVWNPVALDLSKYADRTIDLVFRKSSVGTTARYDAVYDLAPTDLAVWRKPRVRPVRLPGAKNVILISIDTLRADHLGYMGYARPTSPRLDELARNGVVFRQCISQAPWTAPSHFSILTGTYPSTHGGNAPSQQVPRWWNDEFPTLAEILRDRGYLTAAYTGMGAISAQFGFAKGFDLYNETRAPGVSDSAAIVQKASNWIKRNRNRSFFLFLHTFEPHEPYTSDFFVEQESIEGVDSATLDIARYDGDIRVADEHLGSLFDFLAEYDLLDDTLIVVTSDHGEEFGEGEARGYSFPGHHGHSLYDELLHVPLAFYGLDAGKGLVVPWQVRSVDILPTILEGLGIEAPETIQGQSLFSMIRGDLEEDLPAFSEATTYGPERESIRVDGYKYIHRLGYGQLDVGCAGIDCEDFPLTPVHELYDLGEDPLETKNLADALGARVSELLDLMGNFRSEREGSEREDLDVDLGQRQMSPALQESLRGLGYIQ